MKVFRFWRAPRFGRERLRSRSVSWLVAGCVVVLTSGAVLAPPIFGRQAGEDEPGRGVDPGWRPWLGCWESLTGRTGPTGEALPVDSDEIWVCLTPQAEGSGVDVTTYADDVPVVRDTLIADGRRHPVEDDLCRGWRTAQWSQDRYRLFLHSEMDCEDGGQRTSTGLSLLLPQGQWLDIHVFSSAGSREVLVRRYEPLRRGGIQTFPPRPGPEGERSLRGAAQDLSIEDIIEASQKVDPEALEAALMESGTAYDLNAKTLLRLADAGVPASVIDLVVALAFPDSFVITRAGVSEDYGEGERLGVGAGHFSRVYPLSFAAAYDYAPYGYPYYYDSFHHPLPIIRTETAPDSPRGRVVKGRGYTRVDVRNVSGGSDGGSGSSFSGGGGSGGSGSSGGSVSSGGYSSGGASSGRTAVPRGNN